MIRLRNLLAGAFILVAVMPVALLGWWVANTAVENKLSAASDTHSVVARNLASALRVYAKDLIVVFKHVVLDEMAGGRFDDSSKMLAEAMNFKHICFIDAAGEITLNVPVSSRSNGCITAAGLQQIRSSAHAGSISFSPVLADAAGDPTIYISTLRGANELAVGALETSRIIGLQQQIYFGHGGHAAVVDANGTLIAHPDPSWPATMKNISGLEPVSKMMSGQSGTTTFYSPVVNKDMISAYATVPGAGWGVMVPQPIDELKERAKHIQIVALYIIGIGLLIAAALSWILSGILVRPLASLLGSVVDFSRDTSVVREQKSGKFVPVEIRKLGSAFNSMAETISAGIAKRQQAENLIRKARDELEQRVEERTAELQEETAQRRKVEQRLMHHQKMESLGNLAGGLAHNLNNLLVPIIALSGRLMATQPSDSKEREAAEMINQAGQNAKNLVQGILAFSRQEIPQRSDVDIYELAEEVLRLMTPSIPSNINVTSNLDENTGTVSADSSQIQMALMNVMSNAADSLAGKAGKISISLSPHKIGGEAGESGELAPGTYARMLIEDNGAGMDAETLNQAFDPFFTTKDTGRGTGLGLSTAYGIIQNHGGEISCQSTEGAGSTFQILLPLSAAAPNLDAR